MTKFYLILVLLLSTIGTRSQNISVAEYFIDNDPGLGNATALSGIPNQPNVSFSLAIADIPQSGTHVLGFRTKDTNGKWSHTNFSTFSVVPSPITSEISTVEYFWDADAGFGNNYLFTLPTSGTDVFDYQFEAVVPATLAVGLHQFFIRTSDGESRFSHTNYKPDIEVAVLGTDDFIQTGIGIYPNPVVNELNVTIANKEKCRLILYDITGKLLLDTNVSGSARVDMSNFPSGMYTAYFWKESNKIHVVKLIKE